MPISYREATADDALAIARLHADSWRRAYRGAYSDSYLDGPVFEDRNEVWTQRLGDPSADQYVIVAEEDGELVGFACAYGARDERYGSYLDNLHAHPERHRNGIGRGLVREVVRWCSDNYPDAGFHLRVLDANANAQRFYEALGAEDVAREETEPPGGGSLHVRVYAWRRLDDVKV